MNAEPSKTHLRQQNEIERINSEIDEISQTPMYAEANNKARRIIKKNSKEIKRLYALCENALLFDKRESYIYAIRKIRDITKQRYTEELLEQMWLTSRQQVIDIIATYGKKAS
ncbi:hypothetical protein POP12_215 [Pectobacterium phage POP12]|nr:hypothetical protein POP12_215 [Pectobacterium phage POP12]